MDTLAESALYAVTTCTICKLPTLKNLKSYKHTLMNESNLASYFHEQNATDFQLCPVYNIELI